MVFGWFKKKKDDNASLHYDPANIKINQLVKGAFLDFDLKTWEVKAVYEYDWGDNYFSDEFQLSTADETLYLHVEEDDEIACTLSEKINIHLIEGDIAEYIIRTDSPPMKVVYEGETFFRQSENIGYFRNVDNDMWSELISWSYYDKDQKKVLNIERWGEQDFEASVGRIAQEFEFTNIIMP
ncbi:MAG: DUF4178 domain-containing protein [Microscillaceae bacterium]|nr:DUF4178 domain-containing protein [Microscillaceae bacterium]